MKNVKEIINYVKSRGHWFINLYPIEPIKDRIPLRDECEDIIKKSAVHLRGWDYPYVPISQSDFAKIYFGADYVEAFVDSGDHKEVWRYYQSAQFLHYLSLSEDWHSEDERLSVSYKNVKPGSVLNVIRTIYTITEIFEFIRRLAKLHLYDDGINIEILLFGIQNRRLAIFDPDRVPLGDNYIAQIDKLPWSKKGIPKDDLITKSDEIAFDLICYIFKTFNWENLPKEIIKKDQLKFLQRS